MESVTVALIQLAWTSREQMKQTYRELTKDAVEQGAEIVCLPELSLSPYFPVTRDKGGFEWAENLIGSESDSFFSELASQNNVRIIGSLFEKTDDGRYFDTATIHYPQKGLIHYTRKVHIPSGEGYHETDFFEGAIEYPVHDLDSVKISVPTCYDQWFPEMARICTLNGAEFIFYPTAIGSEPTDPDIDTQEAWQTVMRGHAVANGVYIAAANRIGTESTNEFYGSSFISAPSGEILAQAGRDTTETIVATLDGGVLARWRNLFPLLHQRKPHTYARILDAVDSKPPQRWENHQSFQS